MSDASIVVAGLELTALILGSYAFRGFMAWLQQRERERFSATDKAELLAKLKEHESKLLELKNAGLSARR